MSLVVIVIPFNNICITGEYGEGQYGLQLLGKVRFYSFVAATSPFGLRKHDWLYLAFSCPSYVVASSYASYHYTKSLPLVNWLPASFLVYIPGLTFCPALY